ncbi:MAG: efflux RND transporter periplasmic adaptor subunit [Myxococcales bacterium]|nr:efflux RND transporter periplasmic adaptor subunit [Myxococcales bacterium]
MKRIVILLAAISVPLLPIGLAACKRETPAPDGASGGGARAGRGMRGGDGGLTYAVDLLQTEAKKLEYVVTAPGTIEAFERVQVTSRVAGVVDKVAFTDGQEVKKGDVLVVIDSERFRLAVNSSKAALEKAQAAQKDVEAQVNRREGAMEKHPGLIPGEELETYRTKTLTAKADTAVAAENLKIAELNLRDSFVRAPLGGVIQTRTVETGQYVNTGVVMATLLRQDPMLLRFQVEPQEAPRLKPGMKATFTMRETARTFEAKITLVAGAADPTTHMVGVTAEVITSENKYWLRPGSFCDVSVDVGATRDAPVIPRFATRATDNGYVTYVVENDVAQERVITLGMSTKDGWVEVRSGLKGGEWIVVRGAEALSPGARVNGTRLSALDAGAPPLAEARPDDGVAPTGSGRRARGGREAGAESPAP